MKVICKCVKSVLFALILIIGIHISTQVLISKGVMNKEDQYQTRMKEFYEEIPGTLDAVYLGASHVYT